MDPDQLIQMDEDICECHYFIKLFENPSSLNVSGSMMDCIHTGYSKAAMSIVEGRV